jgi:hypothetical protein
MMTSNRGIPCWDTFEAAFDGPRTGNPFTEVELYAIFRLRLAAGAIGWTRWRNRRVQNALKRTLRIRRL